MDLTLLDAMMEGTVSSNPDPQLSQCANRSKASSTKDVTDYAHNNKSDDEPDHEFDHTGDMITADADNDVYLCWMQAVLCC